MSGVDVGQLYGHDVLYHGVGGHQSAPQQVGHHINYLLVQLGKPESEKNI